MSESVRDYYAILRVSRSAPTDEIHQAYRRLARRVHPDTQPDSQLVRPGSPDIRLVNEAWDVLGDAARRSAYDASTEPSNRHRPDVAEAGGAPDADDPYGFSIGLPRLPDGFRRHPRGASGWAEHCKRERLADRFHNALSLVAETPDLSSLSQLGDDDLWLLDVAGLPMRDRDLTALLRFKRLEVLLLDDTEVTDEGLASLCALPVLHTVCLTGCRVTDRGVATLASISSLQNVELDETLITDEGLAAWQGHEKLIVLDIRRTEVKGSGISHLVGLSALRELRVSGWAELKARMAFRGRPEVHIL